MKRTAVVRTFVRRRAICYSSFRKPAIPRLRVEAPAEPHRLGLHFVADHADILRMSDGMHVDAADHDPVFDSLVFNLAMDRVLLMDADLSREARIVVEELAAQGIEADVTDVREALLSVRDSLGDCHS